MATAENSGENVQNVSDTKQLTTIKEKLRYFID